MTKSRYVNSLVQEAPITIGGTVPEQVGTLLSEYDVREYWDLRQSYDAATGGTRTVAMRAYAVSLRQKLSIANSGANSFDSLNPVTGYAGYPVLVVQQVLVSAESSMRYHVEDYTPKTLNAAVSISANVGTTSGKANSVQHSTGSSSSVTNSYEISDSVGFFGGDATGSVSASVGQSTTNTVESSDTTGSSTSRERQTGSGSGMTIKDWASYAFLDAAKQQPSWVWGQEYPWNVIDFRSVTSTTDFTVALPTYVQQRLYDGTTVYPPSELSQFGLDFTATAHWVFYVAGPAASTDEMVSLEHLITFWQGTHSNANTAEVAVLAASQKVDAVTLNLPVLALDPIVEAGARNNAVVGFVKSEFIVTSSGPSSTFRLKSGANSVYVTGSGFDTLATNDSIFSASNVTAAAPARLKLQFKVVSENLELSLYIKHWKRSAAGCVVTVAVNEPDPANPIMPIIRHVDALEAGSGGDNVTVITLRDKDYTSTDFYDYLVMGLNTVCITITPVDGQASCDYSVRAIAIS